MKKITEKEADKLEKRGVATMFDAPKMMARGFFDVDKEELKDVVLIVKDDGYYNRPCSDLNREGDEIFVGWKEQGKPPQFEDVFKVTEFKPSSIACACACGGESWCKCDCHNPPKDSENMHYNDMNGKWEEYYVS